MKNKYNIPIINNNRYLKVGNFIDHYSITIFTYKRRNISKIDWLILYGISLEIRKKTR